MTKKGIKMEQKIDQYPTIIPPMYTSPEDERQQQDIDLEIEFEEYKRVLRVKREGQKSA